MSEKQKPNNSFKPLWYELKDRFLAPVGQVTFWVYLTLGIIVFSACGIWVELGKYILSTGKSLDGMQTAIFTFIPAMACTSTMQIIFSDKEKKYVKSIGYAVGVLLLLVPIGLLMFYEHLNSQISVSAGVILSIISILTWWIANGLDSIFYDNAGPDSSTGGDTKGPLSGDTAGFRTE